MNKHKKWVRTTSNPLFISQMCLFCQDKSMIIDIKINFITDNFPP